MNVLDSELVRGQLRTEGYQLTDNMKAADVVLFNTCSVRQHAEDKVLSRLGALKKPKQENPKMVVGVIGCMAERDPDGLAARIAPLAPGALAFNGKAPAVAFFGNTALAYGRQTGGLGAIPVFVLPSTSPAARRYWDIAPWRDFADFVKRIKAER